MGSLFLVRHATTESSQAGLNLGQRTDAALTPEGLQLAERTGLAIAGELASLPGGTLRMLSSPALRCRQTADRIVDRLGFGAESVEVEAGLWEIDYGDWEGLSADECLLRDPELRPRWERDPYRTSTPGGESGAQVAERSAAVLDPLDAWLAEEPARVAVVVSHNHVIRLRLAAQLELPMHDYRRRIRADPGGYSLLTLGPAGTYLRRLNAVPGPGVAT